jgi:hypothetical protein
MAGLQKHADLRGGAQPPSVRTGGAVEARQPVWWRTDPEREDWQGCRTMRDLDGGAQPPSMRTGRAAKARRPVWWRLAPERED